MGTKAQGTSSIQVTQNNLAVRNWTADLASPKAGEGSGGGAVTRLHGAMEAPDTSAPDQSSRNYLNHSRPSGSLFLGPKKEMRPKDNYVQWVLTEHR